MNSDPVDLLVKLIKCKSITPNDDGALGVIENTFPENPIIYPNPTDGNVSIDLRKNYNNVITEPLDIKDGFLYLNNKPGLGYELNHDFIQSNPDPEWEKISKN